MDKMMTAWLLQITSLVLILPKCMMLHDPETNISLKKAKNKICIWKSRPSLQVWAAVQCVDTSVVLEQRGGMQMSSTNHSETMAWNKNDLFDNAAVVL